MKMPSILSAMLAASLVFASCADGRDSADDPAALVDPLIGTDGPGNVYPGVSAPFGMVQLSPDNGTSGWDRIAGYFWPDTTIAGFSHTHLSGTGAGDLYDISYMPAVPPFKTGRGELGVYSVFSHDEETAQAGYYSVRLEDYDTRVELVATERCGMQRYTFPQTAEATVFLNLAKHMNWDYTMGSSLRVVDDRTVEGYRFSEGWAPDQRVWFVAQFSQPFVSYDIDTVVSVHSDSAYNGIESHIGKFVFDATDGAPVLVRTAISAVDIEGARRNLAAEMPDFAFDSVRTAQRALWNAELSKIEVKGGTRAERTAFYTALYRTMLAPTLFDDTDGRYAGPDGKIHAGTPGSRNYSTFSLWDTYRAAHPLYTFLHPGRVREMAVSMLNFHDQHGMLPVWPLWGNETDMMIGYHAVPVLAEAALKGLLPDSMQNRVLTACVETANRDDYRSIGLYKRLGYVPADLDKESLSKTLEYAYDDYCIAQLARKMGRDSLYNEFIVRSKNYMNVFQPASGFMQPRLSDGEWVPDFDPKAYTEHITESNGWQYLWAVQQDVEGLVRLMRGPQQFEKRLDEMFALHPEATDSLPIFSTGMIGQYAHGNEPSHHVAYLYNYIGKPEKTQRYVSEILRTQYSDRPDGLCGNEDCGQMSAWYVFSAMGFYPVDPVSLTYAIGTPLFEESVVRLPGGGTFTVRAPGVSAERYRIEKMTLNGKALGTPFIAWNEIMAGGVLELTMKK
ncbi:Putative alpha-1,2-mannosidase [Rikenella microfusus]|uniref:Alpha-1,2-mannosidase n=2 Tax=Rikenella microfusus TaxID=28139 RepID=A0A379MNU5_9BACT|nr:GH92 family glycosyl hydrolase [Rikenella microfusus]SUE33404.1 Putative alpha-1,2-mannosidase [Rikenella microfusus]